MDGYEQIQLEIVKLFKMFALPHQSLYGQEYIVKIEIGSCPRDTRSIYEYVHITEKYGFEWENDWWEGEPYVSLEGFKKLEDAYEGRR